MMRTALLVLACASVGCTPALVHSPKARGEPLESAARLESDWTRSALPAEGVSVHATLWDAALVRAAAAQERGGGPRPAWITRYLDRTAFTVVIELEDRHPVVDATPMLSPDGWTFALSLNKGDDEKASDLLAPSDVDLLLVDRFPSPSGAHHHRIAMVVFFSGTLYDAADSHQSVALVVKPKVAEPEYGRSMLGAAWAQRGATLRWRVTTTVGS